MQINTYLHKPSIFVPIAFLVYFSLFDVAIIEWISEQRTDFVVSGFLLLSDLGEGEEYFCVAAFILLLGFLNRKEGTGSVPLDDKMLRSYGWLCLKALVVTGLLILAFKMGFGRSRPDLWIEQGIIDFSPFAFFDSRDFKSFPSGHTQTAFTVAVLISLLVPKPVHWILYSIAALVGISRVVLLQHWPTDVIAGALIGVLVPMLIIQNSSFKEFSVQRS